MKVINFAGANAVGKSTRTAVLIDYLKAHYNYEVIEDMVDEGADLPPKKSVVGLLFENGWFIFGKDSKSAAGWVSLDAKMFCSWESRFKYFNELKKKHKFDVLFLEGSFNNRSPNIMPSYWIENLCDEYDCHLCYYDKVEQFLERCNTRTGQDRPLEWAENASGWRDNGTFKRIDELYSSENSDIINVQRLPIDADKDILVQKYFNTNWEIKDPLEDW